MKKIWIQKSGADDIRESVDFLGGIANRNLIDWDVLKYPATSMLKATNGERNLMHVPVQTVYMVESLGISPQNTPLDTAKSLHELFQVVQWEAHKNGIGEVYFGCRDEETVKFAEHNGMDRFVVPMFRMKVVR